MTFFKETKKGIFISRPNRFIVLCTVDGRQLRAYLPNPGRLWELFFPGVGLYLIRNEFPAATDHTVVAVEREGIPIMLHTHVNNLVARQVIESGSISGLENAKVVRPEITIGRSRFDFLLEQQGSEVVVEVKSCTLVGNRIAMFPDAVTDRGTRHLLELAELSQQGKKAVVLFLVHWPKADYFMPEWHTDLELARTMLAVRDRVRIMAVSVEWLPGLAPGRIRQISIPWDLIAREANDSGSYIYIVKLNKDCKLLIKGLGEMDFRKGFYCYVGSAKAQMRKRLERHQRLRKNLFWDIDYLRAAADHHAAIPIRTTDDLECGIAAALEKIAGWSIPGFGASDCDCGSHLFGMADDPLHMRSFINLLIYFRMDRLERYLNVVPGKQNML